MYTLFLFLSLITSSQTSIPAATLDADAAEIYRLGELLKSSSPPVLHRSQSLMCRMINECCPSIKSRLAPVANISAADHSADIIVACIGNSPPETLVKTCPIISEFSTFAEDEDFVKYLNTLVSVASESHQIDDIKVRQPCSSEEIYAELCDSTKQNLSQSCKRKILVYVAQHNSEREYLSYVRVVKSALNLMINAVKRTFSVNDSTSTVLSSSTQVRKISSSFAPKTVKISITLFFILLFSLVV